MTYSEIGRTLADRPLHLVVLGDPAPVTSAAAHDRPTVMFTCSQHGNEPAGRETCLQTLRNLALTDDPDLVALLQSTAVLFVPSANPDGRAANTRGNDAGTDINRDHLNVTTPEAAAIETVVRDWQPDMVLDLHEYGPGEPVLYDDDVLYLWPRNLNVDAPVHDLAVDFARNELAPCVEAAGYTADEYGLDAAGPVDITQSAGGGDEGIARNASGLRHSLGILIESAVTERLTDPSEFLPGVNEMRRVASQLAVVGCTLDYFSARGAEVKATTDGAPARKTAEGTDRSAPVYFSGQDMDTTVTGTGDPTVAVDPPPGSYLLTPAQLTGLLGVFAIQGISYEPTAAGACVPMGQPAEPLIPLLLDARGSRNAVDATPQATGCAAVGAVVPEVPVAGLLPLSALVLLGGAVLLRRRVVA